MAYALLAIGVLALVLVVNAYWPVRREPMATLSFFAGWLCGELPLQNLVVTVVVAVVFGALGALGSWAGWLGLVLLVLAACGLVGLAVLGARATRVTMAALAATTGGEIALPAAPPPAAWGSWWRLSRAVPFAGRSVSVVRNLDYAGDGAAAHRLDVLSPRTPASGAPVMVYIHGGAWVIGDKREQGKPMMFELVSRGWVCVTINYRLSPKATWPEHIIDCKQALAWVKAHIAEYGGDPGFVAVSGGSAGGHLAALIALPMRSSGSLASRPPTPRSTPAFPTTASTR
jgi:acetyl esterase/lipase